MWRPAAIAPRKKPNRGFWNNWRKLRTLNISSLIQESWIRSQYFAVRSTLASVWSRRISNAVSAASMPDFMAR